MEVIEFDTLDHLAAAAFDGFIVRKDLVQRFKHQYPVPTYVVEFLLGRYCASIDEQEIREGLEIVQRQLANRTVRAGTEELFKSRAREQGSIRIIDLITARLDAATDSYVAELPSLQLRPSASIRRWFSNTSVCSPAASTPSWSWSMILSWRRKRMDVPSV